MIIKPRILFSPDFKGWPDFATDAIGQAIEVAISSQGICNVMLTGGKTAERLYQYSSKKFVPPLRGICFMFGDECCVPPDHSESNYALAVKTLLPKGVSSGCSILRMETENPDREVAAKAYEKLLPKVIDILLLGMGMDGHIASLFPYSPVLCSRKRSMVPIVGFKSPHERLTITPKVIANARAVFPLAMGGQKKGKVLADALKSPEDFLSLPVRLELGATWLLETEVETQLSNYNKVQSVMN